MAYSWLVCRSEGKDLTILVGNKTYRLYFFVTFMFVNYLGGILQKSQHKDPDMKCFLFFDRPLVFFKQITMGWSLGLIPFVLFIQWINTFWYLMCASTVLSPWRTHNPIWDVAERGMVLLCLNLGFCFLFSIALTLYAFPLTSFSPALCILGAHQALLHWLCLCSNWINH